MSDEFLHVGGDRVHEPGNNADNNEVYSSWFVSFHTMDGVRDDLVELHWLQFFS